MTPRIAAVTAASSSAGRSIVGTARMIIGRHLCGKDAALRRARWLATFVLGCDGAGTRP